MKNFTFTTAIATLIVAVFAFSACSSLEPENMTGNSATIYPQPLAQEVAPVPGEDALPFIITPGDGWTVGPNEVVFFKAYLLVGDKYVDVTNSEKTKFDTNYGRGKCVNGDRPDFKNGQEIIVSAMYDKTLPASTTGHFVVPAEYERH